jgi:hypothetical protein
MFVDDVLLVVHRSSCYSHRENYNLSAVSVRFWPLVAVSMECAQRRNRTTRASPMLSREGAVHILAIMHRHNTTLFARAPFFAPITSPHCRGL